MEQTIEQRAYTTMGEFVYQYKTRIKPLIDAGKIDLARIPIMDSIARGALLLEATGKESSDDAETEIAVSGVKGYRAYCMALRFLDSLDGQKLKEVPSDSAKKELTERICRAEKNIENLDSLAKGNEFYEEQRQRRAA